MMEDFQTFGKKIEELVRPATFPIAIKLIRSEAEIPPGSKRPRTDLSVETFLCQNFRMVRTYGWTMAVMQDDCCCKLARTILGWDPPSEESDKWGDQFSVGLYASDPETSGKVREHLHLLNNEFAGVVLSPLTRTRMEPDVIFVYCLPAQAMRLIQAYLYFQGGVMQFTAAGRMGSCHEGIAKTFLTGEPQLVLLGNGDRIWGGADDAEVMFSIPGSKCELIVRGLEATHKGGLRYPIPKYMNYTPGFQASFAREAQRKAGGTLVKAP
jgi:uncharacterized protein (DUF169 family)